MEWKQERDEGTEQQQETTLNLGASDFPKWWPLRKLGHCVTDKHVAALKWKEDALSICTQTFTNLNKNVRTRADLVIKITTPSVPTKTLWCNKATPTMFVCCMLSLENKNEHVYNDNNSKQKHIHTGRNCPLPHTWADKRPRLVSFKLLAKLQATHMTSPTHLDYCDSAIIGEFISADGEVTHGVSAHYPVNCVPVGCVRLVSVSHGQIGHHYTHCILRHLA